MSSKQVNLVIQYNNAGTPTGNATMDGRAVTIPASSVGNLTFTSQTQINSGSEEGSLEPNSRPSLLFVQMDVNVDDFLVARGYDPNSQAFVQFQITIL